MNDYKLFNKNNMGDYFDLIVPNKELEDFILNEYNSYDISPDFNNIFKALKLTPLDKVKLVILGQDPYPTKGVANGLAFSMENVDGKVRKAPMSIRNIFKEINQEYGTNIKTDKYLDSNLSDWANEGILLLNTVLTCRTGKSKSHVKKGWEIITNDIIKGIDRTRNPVIFLLFGGDAWKKEKIIVNNKDYIIKTIHPSPLSASRGFFGCGCFKTCNELLIKNNIKPVDWVGDRK